MKLRSIAESFSARVLRVLTLLLALGHAGVSLNAHAEIEESVGRLNTALAASPQDAGLYLARGELYARHADLVGAEANYLRAAELAPHLPRLDRARGALALAAGQPAEARQHLDRALTLDPRDAEAMIIRSRAHSASGHPAPALADFNGALALLGQPRPELFLERARLFSSPADALRSLDEGIAQIGPVLTLQLRALELEESLGRTEAVLTRLDCMMAGAERRETWLKCRGDVLSRAGRPAEARAAYAAALAEIVALPAWLRESPPTQQLARELARLGSPAS